MNRDTSIFPASSAWHVAAAVLDSLTDRARVSPVLAGPALIEGNRLIVRLPQGDVSVQAPGSLLRQVFKWCDGNRTLQDILARVPENKRDEFGQFVAFLITNRALVDANLLTATAAGWGQQTIAVGVAAPDSVTQLIAQRFKEEATGGREAGVCIGTAVSSGPLEDLLQQRYSIRTFADQSLTSEQLLPLLWTLGGIVHSQHPANGEFAPHRTVASGGGLYLVRWYVVLVRQVANYAAGVYRVDYPGQQQVRLVSLGSDIRLFHRAFLRPWQQTYATGAVFGITEAQIGSLRYRNRSLQYQYLEAGAALQNLSLTAPALGVASTIVGGYSEEHVKRMCLLSDPAQPASGYELVLSSAVFGSPPSPEQQLLQNRMMPIDFVWADADGGPFELPFHLARARLKGREEDEYNTWGKEQDPWIAYVKAHVETIERQGMREPRNVSVATIAQMPGAIDPRTMVRYSAQQYRNKSFLQRPFDPQATYHWVPAIDIATGKKRAVLGEFVYGPHLNAIKISGASYTGVSSSGCAAGRTRDDAVLAGLLEVIERDAFMRHWLTQQPGLRIDNKLLPLDLRLRVGTLEQGGCQVTLQKLSSCAAQVVLASATHDGKHFCSVAAAARMDLTQAAHAALDELDAMVYTRLLGEDFETFKPSSVALPSDHVRLYAQKPYYRRADAVLQPLQAYEPAPIKARPTHLAPLDQLMQDLTTEGLQALFVDITPDRAFIDQGRTPIFVVKAIVPTLIPISFGYAREPRGMLPVVHRASHFPHPFP